jgi:hypothetical protein
MLASVAEYIPDTVESKLHLLFLVVYIFDIPQAYCILPQHHWPRFLKTYYVFCMHVELRLSV